MLSPDMSPDVELSDGLGGSISRSFRAWLSHLRCPDMSPDVELSDGPGGLKC